MNSADRYQKTLIAHDANRPLPGKGSTIRTNQREYYGSMLNRYAQEATDVGEGDAVGDMTEEFGLKTRIRDARAAGQDRPELKARLKIFRDRRR